MSSKMYELNLQFCACGMFLSLLRKFFLASWLFVYCGIRFVSRQPLLIFCGLGTLIVLHIAKILLIFLKIYLMCSHACVCAPWVYSAPRGQEMVLNLLELELQTVAMWVLETEPKSSTRAVSGLGCWAVSPTSCLPSKERGGWSWLWRSASLQCSES